MLTFNLSQSDRISLRKQIASGLLLAPTLAHMTSAELANEETKAEMERQAAESLKQSVLTTDATSGGGSKVRVKITHKGEEVIESLNNAPINHHEDRDDEPRRMHPSFSAAASASYDESMAMIAERRSRRPTLDTLVPDSSTFNNNMDSTSFSSPPPSLSRLHTRRESDAVMSPQLDQASPIAPLSSTGSGLGLGAQLSPIDTDIANLFANSNDLQSATSQHQPPFSASLTLNSIVPNTPQQAFDLNALWSSTTAPPGETPSQSEDVTTEAANNPTIGGNGEGADEDVPMELDDDEDLQRPVDEGTGGEQDFGMFLDGLLDVDKPVTTVPTTHLSNTGVAPSTTSRLPHPQQNVANDEDADFTSIPVVWSGEVRTVPYLHLSLFTNITFSANPPTRSTTSDYHPNIGSTNWRKGSWNHFDTLGVLT